MYLISTDAKRARAVLDSLLASLPVEPGPVHTLATGDHWLVWSKTSAQENLHLFADGFILGKLRFDEAADLAPIGHEGPLAGAAGDLPALLPGLIGRVGQETTVEPLGITNVYRCGSSVSDRQLLLAAEANLLPSPEGVAALLSIGYFPGNSTLFREVERIPFLTRWAPASGRSSRQRELRLEGPDDDALLDRLRSIAPRHVSNSIGLSGGFDSRFVFGVLQDAGCDPRILRFTDAETEIAASIAKEVGVPITSAGAFEDEVGRSDAAGFTLMTDAQIWFGSHQPGRLRNWLGTQDYYHSGQFSDSVIKNAFKTSWKVPEPRTPYWEHLVRTTFLSRVPQTRTILHECTRREDVERHVLGALAYQREYVDFQKRKQWANWLYYLNRGMRWAQAMYMDLSFYSNPVFLLADLDAQLLGIQTGFWENFNNDRVKELTHRVLPMVRTPFVNGQPALPARGPRGAMDKVEYEYIKRFKQRQTSLAALQTATPDFASDMPAEAPPGWDRLFRVPMEEAAATGPYGVGHASVTVAHVLTFLGRVPAPMAP